jgi:hypothetical protein
VAFARHDLIRFPRFPALFGQKTILLGRKENSSFISTPEKEIS